MSTMAEVIGGLIGTMIDPLVFGSGLAAYLFGWRQKSWAVTFGLIAVFAVFLYILVVALNAGVLRIGADKLLFLLVSVSCWSGVCYIVHRLFSRRIQNSD